MNKSKPLYHGYCFPDGVISCAVRWYFRFQLSLRDIEELLFERGVVVTYETIRCWRDESGKGFAHQVKAARRKPGSTWHLDEMSVTLRGEPYLLWRAVDEHGAGLDGMNQTARSQLRLQHAVGGLSVAAISYYVVSLTAAALKAIRDAHFALELEFVEGTLIFRSSCWSCSPRDTLSFWMGAEPDGVKDNCSG